MTKCNYRTPTMRGPNAINANPQRLESPDGTRWATGRSVKRSIGDHRFDAVEVWALKQHGPDGRAVTVSTHRSREDAESWIRGAND